MKLKSRFIIGTIVGGAIGSVAGVVLAPKSGKQTRAAIAKKGAEIAKKGQVFRTDVMKASGTGAKRSLLKGFLKVLRKPPVKKPKS